MSGYIGVQPVPQATQRREYFTATSGQATFNTNGYTPNYIDVYMNGVKLSPADFTASNGSDVVLASGATTGDLIQVVSFTPFNVANQTFIGDVNLSSGAYKIGGNIAINSTRGGALTSLALTGNATFGDNVKAIFGAGSDLSVYHDGSNSYINDGGIGSLKIRADQLRIESADGSETLAVFNQNSDVFLRHDNTTRLATTSAGVNITGVLSSDGLTVDGNIIQTGGDEIQNSGTLRLNGDYDASGAGNVEIQTKGIIRQLVGNTGDISFYDTSGNAKFFWDASAESLGIGNSTPSNNHANANNLVVGNGTAGGIANYVGTGLGWYAFSRDNANNSDAFDGGISYDGSRNLMFHTNAGTERMRVTSAGSWVVGNTAPRTASQFNNQAGASWYEPDEHFEISTTGNRSALEVGKNNSNDGDLITLRKQGASVGSIRAVGTEIAYSAQSVGLLGIGSFNYYRWNTSQFEPVSSGNRDLGSDTYKWKDLHLSGGIQFDSRSNKLDDYEEGNWTPSFVTTSVDPTISYNQRFGRYTKIGNTVYVYLYIKVTTASGGSGSMNISGLPFNNSSNSPISEGNSFQFNYYNNTNLSSGRVLAGYFRNNDNKIQCVVQGAGNTVGYSVSDFTTNNNLVVYGSGTYTVSS